MAILCLHHCCFRKCYGQSDLQRIVVSARAQIRHGTAECWQNLAELAAWRGVGFGAGAVLDNLALTPCA